MGELGEGAAAENTGRAEWISCRMATNKRSTILAELAKWKVGSSTSARADLSGSSNHVLSTPEGQHGEVRTAKLAEKRAGKDRKLDRAATKSEVLFSDVERIVHREAAKIRHAAVDERVLSQLMDSPHAERPSPLALFGYAAARMGNSERAEFLTDFVSKAQIPLCVGSRAIWGAPGSSTRKQRVIEHLSRRVDIGLQKRGNGAADLLRRLNSDIAFVMTLDVGGEEP